MLQGLRVSKKYSDWPLFKYSIIVLILALINQIRSKIVVSSKNQEYIFIAVQKGIREKNELKNIAWIYDNNSRRNMK